MNLQDIGAIIIILCALSFLYWALKNYYEMNKAIKQLKAEGLSKKSIEDIKKLISKRKGN